MLYNVYVGHAVKHLNGALQDYVTRTIPTPYTTDAKDCSTYTSILYYISTVPTSKRD